MDVETVAVMEKTVSAVLRACDSAPQGTQRGVSFFDETRLRGLIAEKDHVLYFAERDLRPPLPVAGREGPRGELWRIDRITYPADDLPTGELSRSIGHWNPPDQCEIFEVVHGQIVIILGYGSSTVTALRCGPGTVMAVPLGAWHLTYVESGPAVVTNIYVQRAAPHVGPSKYFGRAPVEVGLRRIGGGTSFFHPAELSVDYREAEMNKLKDLGAVHLDSLFDRADAPKLLRSLSEDYEVLSRHA